MATEHAPNASEYIVHHLTFLTNHKQVGLVDWSVLHLDTLFFSIGLGLLTVFIMARLAARLERQRQSSPGASGDRPQNNDRARDGQQRPQRPPTERN